MKSCTTALPIQMELTKRGRELLARFDLGKRATTTTTRPPRGGGNGGPRTPSLYDTYLCGLGSSSSSSSSCDVRIDVASAADDDDVRIREEEDDGMDPDDLPIPACRLDDPSRTVCVVTTAALPWRTGTAVNPLLRALYLVRRRVESSSTASGTVALVVPWLESREERIKLYGEGDCFCSLGDADDDAVVDDSHESERGMSMQERWIRDYSSKACGMAIESELLRIVFYPAFYQSSFGSIFPKVDLCNYIPGELVDIAILEEPEHLNWFRMPYYVGGGDGGMVGKGGGGDGDAGTSAGEGVAVAVDRGGHGHSIDNGGGGDRTAKDDNEGIEVGDDDDIAVTSAGGCGVVLRKDVPTSTTAVAGNNQRHKLGWTHRFRFVVGIVHTNYEEYARQYGIGASLIAAPAIGAVSALTIRAHCHQVIKLSDTLPTFAPGKEVTCNVHGVRAEFLEGVDMAMLTSSGGVEDETVDASPVYFIGKLVWAKGFDQMLDLQDAFRRRHGHFFPIDIYGGGSDEKSIVRAFHGRNHSSPTTRPLPTVFKESSSLASADPPAPIAAAVLSNPQSIKEQLERLDRRRRDSKPSPTNDTIFHNNWISNTTATDGCSDDVVLNYLSLGFEVSRINGSAKFVGESRDNEGDQANKAANPLDIIGDLSGKSFDTGIKTSLAVYNIADSSIKNILTMSFSELKKKRHSLKARINKAKEKLKEKPSSTEGSGIAEEERTEDDDNDDEGEDADGGLNKPKFVFDPPASRYEWRRRPIPAKFPGVVDHALLKKSPHKIFLNPSTSEVLCTTTAEALAMNKFVILPRHPSNGFFLQFSNCLPYDTLEECADKVAWALGNSPTPLTEEERRMFTWEAATERLIESSIVTVRQARERAENGMDKTDARIAFWLSESGEKSNMIRNLFQKNSGGDHSPSNG
ncbi:hypothetical protein ACHAXA_000840 [Cyclostephanos tholiformis]|uniref:Digalactosyldiacylglycerol synthase n=1 Tax=Cyclostephanos tholiformis TaxID=382380 RepID=A0ABD3SQP8_9STRA